jgi:TonB family protein
MKLPAVALARSVVGPLLLCCAVQGAVQAHAPFHRSCDNDAVVLHKAMHFPESLRETGRALEAQAVVEIRVLRSGRAEWKRLVQSTGYPALDAAALNDLAQATFIPKVVHCRAVDSTITYRMTYSSGP